MHPLVFYSLLQFPRAEADTHTEANEMQNREGNEGDRKEAQVGVRRDERETYKSMVGISGNKEV